MAISIFFKKNLFLTDIQTDRPTFRQTDRVTYTIRWSRIKIIFNIGEKIEKVNLKYFYLETLFSSKVFLNLHITCLRLEIIDQAEVKIK